jgi:hypothetical protein
MSKEIYSLTLERMKKIAEDRNDPLVRMLVALAELKIRQAVATIKTGFSLLRSVELTTTGFVEGHKVKVVNLTTGEKTNPTGKPHDAFMDIIGRVFIGEQRGDALFVETMTEPGILHKYPYIAVIQTLNQHTTLIFRAREWEARKKFGDEDQFLFDLNLLLDM